MRAIVAVAALGLGALPAGAQEQRRPCGPGNGNGPLRLLFPQGMFGADFRPACRVHDACYEIPGADKAQCDRAFVAGMLAACDQSRTPGLCRATARTMYGAVNTRAAVRIFFRTQPH